MKELKSNKSKAWKEKCSRLGVFIVVVVSCLGSSIAWLSGNGDIDASTTEPDPLSELRPVSIRQVAPQTYQATLSAQGEVVPEWRTALKAQVGGAVVHISNKLKPGLRVQKGEVLVRLDETEYLALVAEGVARLAQAKVRLLKEEREVREAERNWEESGLKGAPPSQLHLRQPQLMAARAELVAAERVLARGRRELDEATIRAPFAAMVVERNIDPGAAVFAGDEIAVLNGTDKAGICIYLQAEDWGLLGENWQGSMASLRDPLSGGTWRAVLQRAGGALERESRLRPLYLEVEKPLDMQPALLSGTFVQVEIPGRDIVDLLALPESALTRKGEVWYVDQQTKQLRKFSAQPLFHRDGQVFVACPAELQGPLQIVSMPTAGLMVGLQVRPISEPAGNQG